MIRPGLDSPQTLREQHYDRALAEPLVTSALPALRRLAGELYGADTPPTVSLLRQRLSAPLLGDIERAVEQEVRALLARIQRPARGPIAVGIGSRGIANLDRIARTVVTTLKAAGFEPFIVPAMGSHGGATAEGQRQVLADYGMSEERTGARVRATMETVLLGEVEGMPVHMDRFAFEAGAVFLISRVKPHTDFRGPVESGLSKMCAIGLGKQMGARAIHAAGPYGLKHFVPLAARLAASRGILIGGLAILENARDETARVQGVPGIEVGGPVEEALLTEARSLMPRIPFDALDVLVVERMGKDISGTGMDTNVLGRMRIAGEEEPATPRVANVVALDLTDASHGNAAGLGLADFVPARLMAKVDLVAFYTNCLTAGIVGVERGQLPIILPTDRDAVLASIACRGRTAREPLRLAWITDTLHTETLGVSDALREEARARDDLELVGPSRPMPFDRKGVLAPLASLA